MFQINGKIGIPAFFSMTPNDPQQMQFWALHLHGLLVWLGLGLIIWVFQDWSFLIGQKCSFYQVPEKVNVVEDVPQLKKIEILSSWIQG